MRSSGKNKHVPMAEDLDKIRFELPERESFAEFLQDKGETIAI